MNFILKKKYMYALTIKRLQIKKPTKKFGEMTKKKSKNTTSQHQ